MVTDGLARDHCGDKGPTHLVAVHGVQPLPFGDNTWPVEIPCCQRLDNSKKEGNGGLKGTTRGERHGLAEQRANDQLFWRSIEEGLLSKGKKENWGLAWHELGSR